VSVGGSGDGVDRSQIEWLVTSNRLAVPNSDIPQPVPDPAGENIAMPAQTAGKRGVLKQMMHLPGQLWQVVFTPGWDPRLPRRLAQPFPCLGTDFQQIVLVLKTRSQIPLAAGLTESIPQSLFKGGDCGRQWRQDGFHEAGMESESGTCHLEQSSAQNLIPDDRLQSWFHSSPHFAIGVE
jgi:hypothetical protein